jgi:hypothetical protein
MIRRDITLVLGAGASRPYGFPSGSELVEQALLLKPELRTVEDTARVGNLGVTIEEFTEFRDALRRSLVTSIDVFLETRRDYMRVGKRVIAGLLLPQENPDSIRVNVEGGWYDYLADLLHAPTVEEWKRNKLKIVTFNYDRSLEFALWGTLCYRYSLSSEAALEALASIPIVHVYGTLGRFAPGASVNSDSRQYSPLATSDAIAGAAEKITILHESQDDSPDFRRAHELLRSSQTIIFLGFGYHPMNVRRLRLRETVMGGAEVFGSMFAFTQNEWHARVVPQFGVLPSECNWYFRTQFVPDLDARTWLRTNAHLFPTA